MGFRGRFVNILPARMLMERGKFAVVAGGRTGIEGRSESPATNAGHDVSLSWATHPTAYPQAAPFRS